MATSLAGLAADAKDTDFRTGPSFPFQGAPWESDLNLIALETEVIPNPLPARSWFWTHCRQVKNSFENRGARLLNIGTVDRKEAIVRFGTPPQGHQSLEAEISYQFCAQFDIHRLRAPVPLPVFVRKKKMNTVGEAGNIT